MLKAVVTGPAAAVGIDSKAMSSIELEIMHKRIRESARTGDVLLIPALLSKGANPDATDAVTGATALHIAASGGHVETAKILVAAGADVNFVDRNKQTPLHRAAGAGHKAVVEFLLNKAKADASLVDKDNLSPAALMVAKGGDKGSALYTTLSKAEMAIAKRKEAEQKKQEEADRKAAEEAERRRAKEEAKVSKSKKSQRSTSLAPGQSALDDINKADRWMSMIYTASDDGGGSAGAADSPRSSESDSPTGTPPLNPKSLLRRLSRTTSDPSIIRTPITRPPPATIPANVSRFTPDPVEVTTRRLAGASSTPELSASPASSPVIPSAVNRRPPPAADSSPRPLSAGSPSAATSSPSSAPDAAAVPAGPRPPHIPAPPPHAAPVTPPEKLAVLVAPDLAVPNGRSPESPVGAPRRVTPKDKDVRRAVAMAVSDSAVDVDNDLPLNREDMMRRRRQSQSLSVVSTTPTLGDIMKRFNGEEETA